MTERAYGGPVNNDARLFAAMCWCGEDALTEVGAQVMGETYLRSIAEGRGLVIWGDIDVTHLDARTDSIPGFENDHPEGMPILIRAECLASESGDAGARSLNR